MSETQGKKAISYLNRVVLKSVLYLNCSSFLESTPFYIMRKKCGNLLLSPSFRIALSKKSLFLNARLHLHNHILRCYELNFYIEQVNDVVHRRNKVGCELRPSKRATDGFGLG